MRERPASNVASIFDFVARGLCARTVLIFAALTWLPCIENEIAAFD
jgi:hypothetical protein